MIEKENKILDSALELFVKKGFHGASTSAIAKNADISNGTLFHYYKSKDELIQKLHQYVKSDQIESISNGLEEENDPKEYVRSIWKQSITWAIKNEDKYIYLNQYKYSPYKKKHKSDVTSFKNKFCEMVEKGVQLKQLKYLPDDFVFDQTNASVYGMIEYLKHNPVKFRTPEFMKQAFEMFWLSVKA